MRNWMKTTGLVAAALATLATVSVAESVAREAVSSGFMTKFSSNVFIGRAEAIKMVGQVRVLEMTTLSALKGSTPTTVQVIARADWKDVKAGDEFLGYTRAVSGEAIGLGSGTYYVPVAPPFFSMVRVTDANRSAWEDRVRTHATGSAQEVIHRCAADVSSADPKIAGDALVDLWHQRSQPLATILSSAEKQAIANAVLNDAGWTKLEGERVHGIIVLGKAKATEAYAQLLTRLTKPITGDLAWSVGEALGQINRAQAVQDLATKVIGTPQQPATPETQLRILGAYRGMAAPETLPTVQSLFDNPDKKVRRWAMVTAGYVGAEPAMTALSDKLQNGEGLDAWCAAFALHRSGGKAGWDEVRRVAPMHPVPETRAWLMKFVRSPAMRGQDVLVKLARGY